MIKILFYIIISTLIACGTDAERVSQRDSSDPPVGEDDLNPENQIEEVPGEKTDSILSKSEIDLNTYTNYGLTVDLREENLEFESIEIKTEPQNGRLERFDGEGRFEYYPDSNFFGTDEVVLTLQKKSNQKKKDIKIRFAVHKGSEKKWKIKINRTPTAGSCQRIIIERYGSLEQLSEKAEIRIYSSRTKRAIVLFKDKDCAGEETKKAKFPKFKDRKGYYTLMPSEEGKLHLVAKSQKDGEKYSKTVKINVQEREEDEDGDEDED